jgi:hypothetical protein
VEPIGDKATLDQIRGVEQELETLELRYSDLARAVIWLKRGFTFFVVLLIGLIALGVIIGNWAFVAAMAALLLLPVGAALMGPRALTPGLRDARWIDAVSWKPPGYLGAAVKRSEAMAVEDMIADRKERLAALRAHDGR